MKLMAPNFKLRGMNTPKMAVLRSQLWSPVQNTALWLGWWLHDVISTDAVIDAFHTVQGKHHRLVFDATGSPSPNSSSAECSAWNGSAPDYAESAELLGDGVVGNGPVGNDLAPIDDGYGLIELLRHARRVTVEADLELEDRPLVSLVLAGPGDVPPLPANTSAARGVIKSGAGIALADGDPEVTHVVIPKVIDNSLIEWTWHTASGRAPSLGLFGPGEADAALREASDRASKLIESSDYRPRRQRGGGSAFESARLAVGSLSDAFGLPGLPAGVPHRAAGLMARADSLAAIVEVTQRSEVGAALDAELIPLLKAVRQARMVAVDYAMRELVRP